MLSALEKMNILDDTFNCNPVGAECAINVLEKFVGIYKVPFYTRCGIRYKDIITKSRYGLSSYKWAELIKPNVIGIAADIEDDCI